ncbi:MAG: S66 peptidase family protein [Microbacter sp.]
MIPTFLSPGDQIAIVSPSSPIERTLLDGVVTLFSSWDLNPVVGRYAYESNGRFAGTKEQRMADLQWALNTKEVKAVFCSRGGYGLIQLIDQLDFSTFELYPKWMIGFSDITVLHAAVAAYGIASMQGPMAKYLLENEEAAHFLKQSLFGELPQYVVPSHALNRIGKVRSTIVGGNLSVLYSLRGTHFEPDFREKILFIEDTNEKPYHVDRMLQNFKLGGIFEEIAGLVVGRFTNYEEDESMGANLKEIIAEVVDEYDFPVCFDFPAGHDPLHYSLPFGVVANLNVENELVTLQFLT